MLSSGSQGYFPAYLAMAVFEVKTEFRTLLLSYIVIPCGNTLVCGEEKMLRFKVSELVQNVSAGPQSVKKY